METRVFTIILVSPNKDTFSDFEVGLNQNADIEIIHADSGERALKTISDRTVDLVVTDEVLGDMTNIEFAGRLIRVNPMIHCASVSGLSPEAFHEASEGLGIMCQLSVHPGKAEAEILLAKLEILTQIAQ